MPMEHLHGRVDHLQPYGAEMYLAMVALLVARFVSINAAYAILAVSGADDLGADQVGA
jgi:hypothetical protein